MAEEKSEPERKEEDSSRNVQREKKPEKVKAEKKEEVKIEERTFTVPLRRKFLRTPRYKRVPKAIKALKKFIARHMKIRDGDLRKVKIDRYLNEEMWFRGIKNPPHKIKVKTKKLDDNSVLVELEELSEKAKFKKAREDKLKKDEKAREKERKAEKEAQKKLEEEIKSAEKETKKEEKEKEEKKASVEEAGIKQAENKAKEAKHKVQREKGPKHQMRKALKK